MRRPLLALLSGCAAIEPASGPTILDRITAADARVMWVGAHPDDETLASSVLAKACIAEGRPCSFFVMNHGQGGECLLPEGCHPDLGTVRGRELRLVAAAYGATLEHHRYFNAPLPVDSFPPRHEIGARWMEEHDPTDFLVRAIDAFQPTVLLTFDPDHGFTGHPEHQLASRFALDAVRKATHRVGAVYYVLNKYWPARMLGRGDDREPTETFDTHERCGTRPCIDVALDITRAHRTQKSDMGNVRMLRPQLGLLFLRAVDPDDPADAPPPLEPAKEE
jgi:LmbE family N-acetylglucosaminyl deacetylase